MLKPFAVALLLVLFAALPSWAQKSVSTNGPRCRARGLEVYYQGGDGAAGHDVGYYGLRNVSPQSCTLAGVPVLQFFDASGHALSIPYGRNVDDMMFSAQPEHSITLEPGHFAHFMLATTTGDQHLQYQTMRVLVPGGKTPLMSWASDMGGVMGIDVSALVAGFGGESDEAAPIQPVERASARARAGSMTLAISARPKMGFDAHLAFVNTGAAPVAIDLKPCSLKETLTNSAGKQVHTSEDCGVWLGPATMQGLLPPRGRMTADINTADDAPGMCRAETWTDALTLKLPHRTVSFAPIPFQVESVMCSDSAPVGERATAAKGGPRIDWSLFSQSGVRFGVQLTTAEGQAPRMGQFFTHSPEPVFAEGQPIDLHFFLDDLGDTPVSLTQGPRAFRIYIRRAGLNVPITTVKPVHAPATTGENEPVTVAPHTWRYVTSLRLSDLYTLGAGDYQVVIAPRKMTGAAAHANAPAKGWPYTQNGVAVSLLLKIAP